MSNDAKEWSPLPYVKAEQDIIYMFKCYVQNIKCFKSKNTYEIILLIISVQEPYTYSFLTVVEM